MRWSERKLIAQISLELYVALLRGQTSGINALIFPFKIKGQHTTKSERNNYWGAQALGLHDSGYPYTHAQCGHPSRLLWLTACT